MTTTPADRRPVVAAAPVGSYRHRPDAWAGYLSRLLALEIHEAIVDEVITAAEADQLLARLLLVIDQAVGPQP